MAFTGLILDVAIEEQPKERTLALAEDLEC